MSEKIISEDFLEKVVGGYTPDAVGSSFSYDGHQCRFIINPPTKLTNGSTWCCRVDENDRPTGVVIQVPNNMLPSGYDGLVDYISNLP